MSTYRNRLMMVALVAGACLWGAGARALDLNDVCFHASFDEGLKADLARGGSDAIETIGKPTLVPGRKGKGKALRLANGTDALAFTLKDNFPVQQGTISFWLSAEDWDGSNGNALQVLMHTDGGDDIQQLVVQTLWPWGYILMPLYSNGQLVGGFPMGRTCSAPLRVAQDAMSVLRKDEWYHYLFTWRDGYEAVYLNGKRMNESKNAEIGLHDLGKRFYLGWKKGTGKLFFDPGCEAKALPLANTPWVSLIDDLTLLNAFVFDHQVAKIYEQGAVEYARRAEPNALALDCDYYQTLKELGVKLIAPGSAEKRGAIKVMDASGKVMREEKFAISGKENDRLIEIALKDAAMGRYTVKATLDSGFATEETGFEIVQPEWLGNTLGTADVVLPPWTPVTVKDEGAMKAVSVWGRTYFFAGPLPSRIVSQGAELLSAPAALTFKTGGKEQAVTWSPTKVESASPTKVVLSSEGDLAGYKVRATTRIEYDGFTWSEFSFKAGAPQSLEAAGLQLKFPKKQCLFLQHPTRRDVRFPKKDGWTSGFESYVYIGNDTAGIQWYAESDQNWKAKDAAKVLEAGPTKIGGVFKVHFVKDPAEMPAEFSLAFGLMATPVRPRPADWRGWGNTTPYRSGLWTEYTHTSLDYSWWAQAPGWLIPNHRESARHPYTADKVRWWMPFTSGTFLGVRPFGEKQMDKLIPLWAQFAPEWRNMPMSIRMGEPGGWNEARINPSKSFVDNFAWQVEELFKNYDVDGLYFDGYPGEQASCNLKAGFGYVDADGKGKSTYPILAGREMMRRTYAIVTKYRPRSCIMLHPATTMLMPVFSFAHASYDGEHMGWGDIKSKMEKGGIRASLTDEWTRMVLSYKMFGQVAHIDSRFVGRNAGTKDPRLSARVAMGVFLLNDVHGWGSMDGYNVEMTQPLDWWGIINPDIEYLPYYDEKPVATAGWASESSVYVQRAKGKALIVTFNDSTYGRNPERLAKEGQHGFVLEIDLERLGLTPGKVRAFDVESYGTRSFTMDGNKISLTMDPSQVRLIGLERTK
jgi:hypothetical protein